MQAAAQRHGRTEPTTKHLYKPAFSPAGLCALNTTENDANLMKYLEALTGVPPAFWCFACGNVFPLSHKIDFFVLGSDYCQFLMSVLLLIISVMLKLGKVYLEKGGVFFS